MKDEFTYGELVEVRDYNSQEWFQRYYVATVEFPDTGKKWYCTHSKGAKANDHANGFDCWHKIRKIQPDPVQDATPPTAVEGVVLTAQEAVMHLQERIEKLEAIVNGAIKHINEQIQSIKKQLK